MQECELTILFHSLMRGIRRCCLCCSSIHIPRCKSTCSRLHTFRRLCCRSTTMAWSFPRLAFSYNCPVGRHRCHRSLLQCRISHRYCNNRPIHRHRVDHHARGHSSRPYCRPCHPGMNLRSTYRLHSQPYNGSSALRLRSEASRDSLRLPASPGFSIAALGICAEARSVVILGATETIESSHGLDDYCPSDPAHNPSGCNLHPATQYSVLG